jgi:uncharacterized protein YdhG (YjbR/CyaY superfamily)
MTIGVKVDACIAAQPPAFAAALTALRTRLRTLLPDVVDYLCCAMPGFRMPGPRGRMVVGHAAFTHHLGLYPHSGSIIPQIDCTPFKTSKSGVLFTPQSPLPEALLRAILTARMVEFTAGHPSKG